MTETLQQLIDRLRVDYLADIPARLDEFRSALQATEAGDEPGTAALVTLFHRLSGSAGAYGFGQVSAICRDMERWLDTRPIIGAQERARLLAALAAIEEAFRRPPSVPGLEQP